MSCTIIDHALKSLERTGRVIIARYREDCLRSERPRISIAHPGHRLSVWPITPYQMRDSSHVFVEDCIFIWANENNQVTLRSACHCSYGAPQMNFLAVADLLTVGPWWLICSTTKWQLYTIPVILRQSGDRQPFWPDPFGNLVNLSDL